MPYLRYLLSVDPGDPAVLLLAPRDRRAGVFAGLRALLLHKSHQKPLVILVEDLHWIDEQSQEALAAIADIISGAPVLLILTYRPGYASPLGERSYATRLALETLPAEESAALVNEVLGANAALPAALQRLILAKAEGNPFFIEEVTHALLESGLLLQRDGTYVLERPVEQIRIPDSIQEILLSRIDRLEPPTKQTVQLASIIGREFAERLLARISDLQFHLEGALHELKQLELIYEKSYFPELAYIFKHALTQDVAYSTVLRERRKVLHRMVGGAIEELYDSRLAEHYELLAWHYGEGEDWPKAVEYLIRAGDKAMAAYANQEALDFYARALDLSERLAASGLPTALQAAEGRLCANLTLYQVDDAKLDASRVVAMARRRGDRAYEARSLALLGLCLELAQDYKQSEGRLKEALELAQEVDDERATYFAKIVLADLYSIVGRHEEARSILPQVEHLVPSHFGPVAVCEAGALLALVRAWRGEFGRALEWMNQWRMHEATGKVVLGTSFLEVCDLVTILALAGSGAYSRAITVIEQILASCERAGEKWVYSRTLNTLGWIYQELGDYERAIELNQRSAELGRQLPNDEVVCNALLNLGDCLQSQGRVDEAEVHYLEVERVVRAPEAAPMEEGCWMVWRYAQHLFHSYGELWLARGDTMRALVYADECLVLAERSETRKNIVKGRRLRGQALLAQGKISDAVTEMEAALALAREVGNPPQLWRTLVALGDLRRAQRKPAQARRVYGEALRVVNRVAAELTESELRRTFLGSDEVLQMRSKFEAHGRTASAIPRKSDKTPAR